MDPSWKMSSRGIGALLCLVALAPPALAAAAVPAAVPDADGAGAVRRAAAAYAALERAEVEKLTAELDALARDPKVLQAFRARDRAALLALAKPRFEALRPLNVNLLYFLEPEPTRTCFLRVHRPELFGDVVDRVTLSQAIATHRIASGKELGKTAFALRVVRPLLESGRAVGYLELGEEIDHLLTWMKAQTGDDYAVLVDKARVDRKELARIRREDRWDERPELVLVDSTVWNERTVSVDVPLAKLPESGAIVPRWVDGAHTYVGGAFPLRDASGRVVGALFVRHDAARP